MLLAVYHFRGKAKTRVLAMALFFADHYTYDAITNPLSPACESCDDTSVFPTGTALYSW